MRKIGAIVISLALLCIAGFDLWNAKLITTVPDLGSVQQVLEQGFAITKSFLDTDWLSVVSEKSKIGLDSAISEFRVDSLQLRRLNSSTIDGEHRALVLSLRDPTLQTAMDDLIASFKPFGASGGEDWKEATVHWPFEDHSALDELISSSKCIEVDQDIPLTRNGDKIRIRFRLRKLCDIRQLATAIDLLHSCFWPMRRFNAAFTKTFTSFSPPYIWVLADLFLEFSVWVIVDGILGVLWLFVPFVTSVIQWIDSVTKMQESSTRGLIVLLPTVLIAFYAFSIWIELVFGLVNIVERLMRIIQNRLKATKKAAHSVDKVKSS